MTWEERLAYLAIGFLGATLPRIFRGIVKVARERERIVNEKHLRGIK